MPNITLIAIYLSSQIILFIVPLYLLFLFFIIIIYSIYCSKLFPKILIYIIAHYHSYLLYSFCQVNLFNVPLIIIIIIVVVVVVFILIHYFELSIFMVISLGTNINSKILYLTISKISYTLTWVIKLSIPLLGILYLDFWTILWFLTYGHYCDFIVTFARISSIYALNAL